MAKRLHEDGGRWRPLLLLIVACSCVVAYFCIFPLLQTSFPFSSSSSTTTSSSSSFSSSMAVIAQRSPVEEDGGGCCRGLEHTELWSDAVNVGSDFLVDSTQECCDACKANRKCNSWVYCADLAQCGSFHRQCWLKRQHDPLNPDIHDSSSSNPWTSGLVFEKDVGIVGLAIDNGNLNGQVIHIKLLHDCSPQSVFHILELAKLTHCQGCQFYRAEGRGKMWDPSGGHISKMSRGPPYAVVQGTLEAQHVAFKRMAREYTPAIRRGMVGWVGGGPDFFISLANHDEWPRKHTVFATVVDKDLHVLEKLAELPTTATTWENVAIQVLDSPVTVKLVRPALL